MTDTHDDEALIAAFVDDPDVRAAVDEASGADADLAELEDRVVAGDADVTGDQIDEAETRGRIARLRARGAAKRAADKLEKERLAKIAALEQLIKQQFGAHEGGIVDAFDAAVEALVPFLEAVATHNRSLDEITDELLELQPLPQGLRPTGGGQLHLPTVDVFVGHIATQGLLAEAAWRAIDRVTSEKGSATRHELGATSDIEKLAGITRSRDLSERHGIPPRADGVPGPSGLSDVLRRTARIVSARKP